MEEQALYLLIIRHLEGNTSEDENNFLSYWLQSSPDHVHTYEQFRSIWQAGRPVDDSAGVQAALQQVKSQLGMGKRYSLRRIWPYVAAACVLFLIATGSLLFKRADNVIAYTIIKNDVLQKRRLQLPDGTVVHLAQESSLRYPQKFDAGHRDIYLEGAAFFEVSANPHQPFVVHSGTWETQVLGTRFNISAFPQQQRLSISLLSGKVAVKESGKQQTYVLLPGKELSVIQRQEATIRDFDEGVVTGWMSDQLVFRNEPLWLAADRMALMYGVKIVLTDKSLTDDPLWGTFKQEPLLFVLEAIKMAGNIDYTISGKTVYLKKKSASQ